MPQSLEDLVEQFREEGLSESEAVKAAKKRFLQETKAKPKQKRKIIKAKQGGSIGNKLVASIYGGCN